MAVDKMMLDCVAFVGEGDETNFIPAGTGFFVFERVENCDLYYFVTAAHNVWPRRAKREDNEIPEAPISLRLNRSNGIPKVVPIPRNRFVFGDRFVDLCMLPIDILEVDPTIECRVGSLHLETTSLSTAYGERDGQSEKIGLELGDELFIIGAFVNHVGTKSNIPIVRVCNLAAHALEPIAGGSPRFPAYLIETRSLGGTSGSPVFMDVRLRGYPSHFVEFPQEHGKMRKVDMSYRLVGMVIGAHGGDYSSDFVRAAAAMDDEGGADVAFNAGISVMLPVEMIEVFMETMKPVREQAVAERKKQSGYFSTSARREPPPAVQERLTTTIEGDDQHKERFTALLDAAVGKPKQGG